METNFAIRLGMPGDIHPIAEVFADSVRELCGGDYPPEVIADWQNSVPPKTRLKAIEQQRLWIAEVDGRVGGYLVAVPGEIIALFVGSAYVGRGIGSALVKLGIVLSAGQQRGPVKLEATLTAVPFYKKFGFKEIGRGYSSHNHSGLKIPVVNMVSEPRA